MKYRLKKLNALHFLIGAILLLYIVTLLSCKHFECVSKKTATVTVIHQNGSLSTIKIPYCDTIKITKPLLDTSKISNHVKRFLYKS